MERQSTGKLTNKAVMRLELSYLIKIGLIKKNAVCSTSLSWNNDNSIYCEVSFTEEEKHVRLSYSVTKRDTGEEISQDYKIQFTSIPSNLGKGEVIYFVCPSTGRKARILYLCYGSLFFRSRKAYKSRIYYPSQISSKSYYHSDRSRNIEKEIEKCYSVMKKRHYKRKPTRLIKRIRKLESDQEYHDSISANYMLARFYKHIYP